MPPYGTRHLQALPSYGEQLHEFSGAERRGWFMELYYFGCQERNEEKPGLVDQKEEEEGLGELPRALHYHL